MCPCSYVHDLATTDMRSLLSIRRRNPTDKKARNKKSTKKQEQLAVTAQQQVTQAQQAKQANSTLSQHQQVESKVEQSDASAGGGNSTKNLSKKRRKLNSEAPEGTTSTDTCISGPSSSSSKVMFTATPQDNPLLFPPYPDSSHLNTTSLSTQNFCIPLDKTTLNYAQFPGVEIRCGEPDSMGPLLPDVAMSSSTTRGGGGGKANNGQQGGGVQAGENFMFPEALDFAQLTPFYNHGTSTTTPVNCSNNSSQQQKQQQTNCLSYPAVTHHKLPALYDETRIAACPSNPPQTIPSTITSSSSDKMTKISIENANNISIQINHNTAALDASNLNNGNTFTPAAATTTTSSSSNNIPYVEKTSFEFLNLDADLQSLEKYFQHNAYTPTPLNTMSSSSTPTDTTDQYHSSSASMPRTDSCSSKESTKDATQTNYSSSLKKVEVSNNNNNTKDTNLSSSSQQQQQQTQTQHHQGSSSTANFFEPTPLDQMSAYDDILYPMYNIS